MFTEDELTQAGTICAEHHHTDLKKAHLMNAGSDSLDEWGFLLIQSVIPGVVGVTEARLHYCSHC